MAGSFQHHTIVGRLGGDPKPFRTPSGATGANFDVAVNETRSDGSERPTWFRVTAWNGLGETCAQHLTTGRLVLVEGNQLATSTWIDQQGEPRASLELTARSVTFLDSPPVAEEEDVPPTPSGSPTRKQRSVQARSIQVRTTQGGAQGRATSSARRTRTAPQGAVEF